MAEKTDEQSAALDAANALSAEDIKRIAKEGFERRLADTEDRRRKRGKYAPPTGTCRACGGTVRAEIAFDHRGVIGGPPVAGHVARWSCESCFIVYAQCPPPVETKACPDCRCNLPGCPCATECATCHGTGRAPADAEGSALASCKR